MSPQVKIKPDDTRARIMDTAEALFRRLGFAKTAVAAELKMSPANVYRFFPPRRPSLKRSASDVWASLRTEPGRWPARVAQRPNGSSR
jgi:hypothetical protein